MWDLRLPLGTTADGSDAYRKQLRTSVLAILLPISRAVSGAVEAPQGLRHGASRRLPRMPLAGIFNPFGGGQREERSGPLKPEEIKEKISGIPVYTVANHKNECVLIQGDKAPSDGVMLGLFFLARSDAAELVKQVAHQDKSLGEQARVEELSMDMAYDVITQPPEPSLRGVCFKFMPDMAQVKRAQELHEQAGRPLPYFDGVPLFQAKDLTVQVDGQARTPIFFAKEDLDLALGSAYSARRTTQLQEQRAKIRDFRKEHKAACDQMQFAEANDEGVRKSARQQVEEVEEKLEAAERHAHEIEQAAVPKVEVGNFEEVLRSMAYDKTGRWRSVLFMPAGSVTSSGP